jgi:putative spermidine/putrescine transport system substrate-binding protein
MQSKLMSRVLALSFAGAVVLAACAAPPASAPAAPAAPAATEAPAAATEAPAAAQPTATTAPAAAEPTATARPLPTPPPAAEGKTPINIYSDSDTNITDWYANVIIPAFEAKFPQYDVNIISTKGVAGGIKSIVDRAQAAMETNADPQAELIEVDPAGQPDSVKAGLWMKLDDSTVPGMKEIIDAARVSEFGVPYRGSQVLLAYDSSKLAEADVPKTFADLIEWVKANPGQFTYNRPDKGGSGGNFVVRAIYEVTGKDPSKFKAGPADEALLAEYDKAWELLRSIHEATYDKGAYPSGNQPALQLLANGSVTMIPAWSDQALQALNNGALPETIKLAQFTDLPMPGGYAMMAMPKNAKNAQGAQDFLNFLLSPEMQVSVVKDIGGFPAVAWSLLPGDLQSQFNSVITDNVPAWPGGDYNAARNKGWYEQVATNMQP